MAARSRHGKRSRHHSTGIVAVEKTSPYPLLPLSQVKGKGHASEDPTDDEDNRDKEEGLTDGSDKEAFGGLSLRQVRSLVVEAQAVFPMRVPKPKGLARLLNPELAEGPPQYDHEYPWNLQPFDFAPPDDDLRPGIHRPSRPPKATHMF